EGHNDAVMVFCVLLSLYFWVRGRFGESVLAAGVGALVKIVAPLFAPLELAYAWRTRQSRKRIVRALAVGGATVAAIACIAYAPLWVGRATFDGVLAHARPNLMSGSTPSVLFWFLTRGHSDD